MSGHSKWATIKRKKAKIDAQRGKVFTKLAKDIIVAAKSGGGDPEANMALKNAVQKAKEANIPNDNIQRAIMRGTGELEGANYEEVTYEGYGPGGVAVLLDILTDNRNRTAGEIRHAFDKYGGNLGETGCVSWMFEKQGIIILPKNIGFSEDDLMLISLEAGADDFRAEEEVYEITCAPDKLDTIQEYLNEQSIRIEASQVTMVPQNTVSLTGKNADQMDTLIDLLEDHDDVQEVYTNYEA
ncbi:MAG: YebC/PmpR family DNA-binding transcriptional regulator [Firmicutes bacterium]|nr:YebC/PmpR family DNA-binding transcriptional regulator [Bacillota bacterium]